MRDFDPKMMVISPWLIKSGYASVKLVIAEDGRIARVVNGVDAPLGSRVEEIRINAAWRDKEPLHGNGANTQQRLRRNLAHRRTRLNQQRFLCPRSCGRPVNGQRLQANRG